MESPSSFLTRHQTNLFLSLLMEKCNNLKRLKSQFNPRQLLSASAAKSNGFGEKFIVLYLVEYEWRTVQGIAEAWRNCQSALRSSPSRRKGYLQDNASPPVALSTHKATTELGWEILPQVSYSPNLTPSNNLFPSIQNSSSKIPRYHRG